MGVTENKCAFDMITTSTDRRQAMLAWMDGEHVRYRRTRHDCPSGFYAFPETVRLSVEFPMTPLLEQTLADFQKFLGACMGVRLELVPKEGEIVFGRESGKGHPESFGVDVQANGVRVRASHERGILYAVHDLERRMADGGGPYLPLGSFEREPTLSPRFSEGIFIPGNQSPTQWGTFSDAYLGLMAHFGANAMKIFLNLFDLWKSSTLPELNTSDFDALAKVLRTQVQRLGRFGIDLFLQVNVGTLDANHPVFSAHPEVRGSRERQMIEEWEGQERCALCSANPKVRRAYQETLHAIFSAIPELGGMIMIVGGEGFQHCFMRSADVKSGETNCPHCHGKDASQEVASLVNAVYEGLPEGKRLFAWPYSAFVWSGDDRMQSRWITYLRPEVEVLTNFDCFDVDEPCGVGARFYDYNIKLIGPSSVFQSQRDACLERGMRIHVKTETQTTPDTFFLPYLPVYFRWFERFKAIRESGASGFMGQWRFYGMNGSIPEELQYHSVWNPERSVEELLSVIARRDFDLDGDAVDGVVGAWRLLSESWDDFPYSAMTAGERNGYMRGPWYLGPAHPLILTPQNRYHLIEKFFSPRGDLAELIRDEEERKKFGKPRYIDDLWICLPFGIKRYLEFARRCRDRWDEGLKKLKAAIGSPNARAQMEWDVCETISVHLHTLVNTVEFLEMRDRIGRDPHDVESLDQIWRDLVEILDREIANASRSLPILERDPRIGFGHSYGEVYDLEMVKDKIRQCQSVRDEEIPRLKYFMRFHLWQLGD